MSLTKRDQLILSLLKRFRVLSRHQLEKLVCPEVANPTATINRIMKRLSLNLYVTTIPMPKDQPYLYMPNPAIIHHKSQNVDHFLGIADIYIELGQPDIFEVEPQVSKEYRPDAYTILDGKPVVIEYQRSRTKPKIMEEKVKQFVKTYNIHKARTLWICTDYRFDLKIKDGFDLKISPIF